MNHDPNQTKFVLGDVVIHDADAKQSEMLRVVVGVRNDGERMYTIYLHGHVEKQVYCDHRNLLHDPAMFGIKVESPPVSSDASCIVPGKDPYETVRRYIFLRYRLPRVEYPLPLKSVGFDSDPDMSDAPKITVAVYEPTGDTRNMEYRVGASWKEYEYEFKGLRVL